jgi:glycopeptide antibiotics resistance protein
MRDILYGIVEWVAVIHNHIMTLNDAYEYNFSDKELHFLVIGILGMLFIFGVYPLFKWLAKHNHVMVIAWIYVFTLILVITFAIEIGQKVSNTGTMDFGDIVFGVVGFAAMFLVFSVIRGIWHLIVKAVKRMGE